MERETDRYRLTDPQPCRCLHTRRPSNLSLSGTTASPFMRRAWLYPCSKVLLGKFIQDAGTRRMGMRSSNQSYPVDRTDLLAHEKSEYRQSKQQTGTTSLLGKYAKPYSPGRRNNSPPKTSQRPSTKARRLCHRQRRQ